jgi:hypothetical protein
MVKRSYRHTAYSITFSLLPTKKGSVAKIFKIIKLDNRIARIRALSDKRRTLFAYFTSIRFSSSSYFD